MRAWRYNYFFIFLFYTGTLAFSSYASLSHKELTTEIATMLQEELDLDSPPIVRFSEKVKKELPPYLASDDCCDLTLQNISTPPRTAYFMLVSKDHSFPFSVHFTESIEVPSFIRRGQKGSIIHKAQLTSVLVPAHIVKEHTILTEDMIEGKQLIRTVEASKPLSQRDFSSVTVIQKLDRVDIMYETSSLSIRTTGIALESKGQGEKIRVKNEKSNRVIQGIVISAGLVSIPPVPSLNISSG